MKIEESLVPQVRILAEHIVGQLPEPERSKLRAQARTIVALEGNLAAIYLEVDRNSTEPSPRTVNPIEIRPEVFDGAGASVGFIMLWRDDDGYLDMFEYTWWADETPSGLPAVSDLRPWMPNGAEPVIAG